MPDSVPASIRRSLDAVERLDLDVRAERHLRHRDVQDREQILSSPVERRATAPRGCRTNRSPAGPPARPSLPDAAHAELHPVGDAGRDVHRHRLSGAHAPFPEARLALVGDLLPRALARRCTATRSSRSRRCSGAPAGPRRSRGTSGRRRAPSPAARRCPGTCRTRPAARARSSWRTPNAASVNDSGQQRRQVLASTGARRPAATPSAPAEPAPEEHVEDVLDVGERRARGPPDWPNVS